jgi:transposase
MAIKKFAQLKESEKIELLYLLSEKNNLLEEEIKKLKARLDKLTKKNSNNSHKPPSSDQDKKKKTMSLRKKSKKKPGGQPGHKGTNLKPIKNPDEVYYHSIAKCECCGDKLTKKPKKIVKRQVFEIPKPEFFVTEYQAEVKKCRGCGHNNMATFPEGVNKQTQYGPRAKSLMVYLSRVQLLPYRRAKSLFKVLYDQTISQGTIYNAITEGANCLKKINNKIADLLSQSNVLNSDETGMNVSQSKHWLHVASNDKATHYGIHKNRGSVAMDHIGILSKFSGTMVHDCWRSYFKFKKAIHALCNQHHLRELKYINEVQNLRWAKEMSDLLLEINRKKKRAIRNGRRRFYKKTKQDFITRYNNIIDKGQMEQSSRGTKDSKNLLHRLYKYQKETLLFMEDFRVPFTNNQAERDIRMEKVQQKITGGFRTLAGAKNSCTIRGVMSTVAKNGKNILDVLEKAFLGKLKLQHVISTS